MGPFLGGALKFFGALVFGAGAGASAAYVLAVNVARVALLSLAAKLTAPKLDLNQSAADKLLTVRSTVQPQAFVYGQDMLSGPLIFANTAGPSNEELHRLVALTGREIDSFVAFRIDDTDIVIGVDIADDNDVVSAGLYEDVVEIRTRKGGSGQTAISDMTTAFPGNWTSAHRCRGWSLLYTKMTLQGNNTAFENGIPQNLRALIKGHKVYDPRLDSTNGGSGSHRLADDSTWEWSENPALILADFLRWDRVGIGEEDDRIDWTLCATAADVCDETVAIPTSTTQKRYTCNFTFFANQERGQIKEIIETSMLGRSIFSQGKWRMWAGDALTSDVTLSEANLAGSIQLQATTGSAERYNRVRGKFVDPSRNYTAAAYPEQRNSTYETADGEVRYITLDLNACNNSFEAQRAAIIKLRQSRNQRVMVFEGNWSCFRIQPGTVVEIDIAELGFTGEKFFITEWTLDKDGKGVNLSMVEEDDTVWNDPLEGDYTVRTPTGELVFVGQSGLAVKLSPASIHNERFEATATAGVRLNSSGQLEYGTPSGGWTIAGVPANEWLASGSIEYWVRATVNSGTLATGTEDTWEALSSSRSWTVEQASAGTANANITLEIASDSSGSTIVASAAFDLQAEYTVTEPVMSSIDSTRTRVSQPGFSASAIVQFNSDGSITGSLGSSDGQINPGEWWPDEPEADIGDSYDVRCASVSEGTWTAEPTTVGTWITISGTPARLWRVTRNSSTDGPGETKVVATFEIRALGGGPVLATATATVKAILT